MKRSSKDLVVNCVGMSNIAASTTTTQNDLERWKLSNTIQQLENEEKWSRINNGKEILKLKEKVLHHTVSGHVYRQHSFDKYDPYRKQSSKKYDNFSNSKFSKDKEESWIKSKNPDEYVDKKVKETSNLPVISKYRLDRSTTDLYAGRPKVETIARSKSFDNQSLPEIPLSLLDAQEEEEVKQSCFDEQDERECPSFLPVIKPVALWTKLNTEEIEEKPIQKRDKEITNGSKSLNIFAGNCRTSASMKKFIEKETENILKEFDSVSKKKYNREHKKLIKMAKLPEFINRTKSTSAIIRDFRLMKRRTDRDFGMRNTGLICSDNYNHVLRFLELAENLPR